MVFWYGDASEGRCAKKLQLHLLLRDWTGKQQQQALVCVDAPRPGPNGAHMSLSIFLASSTCSVVCEAAPLLGDSNKRKKRQRKKAAQNFFNRRFFRGRSKHLEGESGPREATTPRLTTSIHPTQQLQGFQGKAKATWTRDGGAHAASQPRVR